MRQILEYRDLLGRYYRLRSNGVTAEEKAEILKRLDDIWKAMSDRDRKKIWRGR